MPIPLRLLMLEDNPSDAALVLDALRHADYEPFATCVDDEEGFLGQLQLSPEIILADYTLPTFDARQALQLAQERGLDVPFIIVSGTIGEERAVQIMQLGATDYVIKDRLGRLGSAVKASLENQQIKRARLKAEQRAAALAAIVETSGEAIIAQTLDGVVTSCNHAVEDLYGYAAAELIGKDAAVLYPKGRRLLDVPENFEAILARVARNENVAAFETVRVKKDGRRIEVLLSISPILGPNGSVTGISSFALDITDRKRSESFLNIVRTVTIILGESRTLEQAAPRVLQSLAESLRCEVAVLWTVDRAENVLRRTLDWQSPWADPRLIEVLSRRTTLESGVGIAGRAWLKCEPVWELGVAFEGLTAETQLVGREGLRGGFGLPMCLGTEMLAVIEFFIPDLRAPDKSLTAALENIAEQIGQFYERRRSENALLTSEKQFRQLADAMPQIVWTSMPNGVIDYFNERWYQFVHCSSKEHQATNWVEFIHPDDVARWRIAWSQSISFGSPLDIDLRFIEPTTSRPQWFLCRAVADRDSQGVITRWFGTSTNIDDQKRIAEELRVGEERYRSLVMALPAAVYTTDKNGFITLFNEHAAELWGRRPEIGIDRWCGSWKMFRPDGSELPRDQCPMAVTLRESHAVRDMELIVERPNGSRIHTLPYPELIRNASGDIVGAVKLVVDLTPIKKLEEQYRHSQKMEAVGQLAAGLAHDFNNLLTVISGYSEILLSDMSTPSPTREKVLQIRKAGDAAAALTRQLLVFGRKQILTPIVLDLNLLLSELEKMLRRLFGVDIEMVTALQPNIGLVKVDPGQVEQVIINLVVNARDAMPVGGQLIIRTGDVVLGQSSPHLGSQDSAGPYVMITVSDTGIGMSSETKRHIFEPFFTTKDVGKGTGLGLATVFGIVQQSGGFIEVDSTVGSGTTFRIFFPRVVEAIPVAQPGRAAIVVSGGAETILLVDDNDGLLELAQIVLKANGYKVLIARNGIEAVKVSNDFSGPIHLLLTDVVMPKMTGRQLADHLRSSRPNMNVLFMSGYTDDTVTRHGIKESRSAVLSKPFTPAALAQKIREVLDGADMLRPSLQPCGGGLGPEGATVLERHYDDTASSIES